MNTIQANVLSYISTPSNRFFLFTLTSVRRVLCISPWDRHWRKSFVFSFYFLERYIFFFSYFSFSHICIPLKTMLFCVKQAAFGQKSAVCVCERANYKWCGIESLTKLIQWWCSTHFSNRCHNILTPLCLIHFIPFLL